MVRQYQRPCILIRNTCLGASGSASSQLSKDLTAKGRASMYMAVGLRYVADTWEAYSSQAGG